MDDFTNFIGFMMYDEDCNRWEKAKSYVDLAKTLSDSSYYPDGCYFKACYDDAINKGNTYDMVQEVIEAIESVNNIDSFENIFSQIQYDYPKIILTYSDFDDILNYFKI